MEKECFFVDTFSLFRYFDSIRTVALLLHFRGLSWKDSMAQKVFSPFILKHARKPSKGFTLVELLVVIAIIALLLSILMPSLQRARELAQQVVCGARQKQLSVALTTYSEGYNGYIMPWATQYKKGATAPNPLNEWVSPINGRTYNKGGLDVTEEYWYSILYTNKGIDSRDIFFCPGMIPANNKSFKAITGKDIDQYKMGWTIGMRQWAYNDDTRWASFKAPKKVSKLPHPSDFFLLCDAVCIGQNRYKGTGKQYGQMFYAPTCDRVDSSSTSFVGPHARHSDKVATIFGDGHAEFKPYQYFVDLQDPKNWQVDYELSSSRPGYYPINSSATHYWMRYLNGTTAKLPIPRNYYNY
jgi:prepilin-type N-terminal cleavage/methylation domain-containing protein